MAELQCRQDLENYINDYNTFISGDSDKDVTLSDNFVMNSYRKFAISDLIRHGKKWSSTETYQFDDVVSFNGDIYIAKNANINLQPDQNTNTWLKIEVDATVEGLGFHGYVSFYTSGGIIISKNVKSVSSTQSNNKMNFEIILDDNISAAAGERNVFVCSSYDLNLNTNRIVIDSSTSYPNNYSLAIGTYSNDGNKIVLTTNSILVQQSNFRIDMQILKV